MTNHSWKANRPPKKTVKALMDFNSQLTSMADSIDSIEENKSMFQNVVFQKAVVVLNDLSDLNEMLKGKHWRLMSPDKVEDVKQRFSFDGEFKCTFTIEYYGEDDEITEVNWYEKNKKHVYEVLKSWVMECEKGRYNFSDLEHETDFIMGRFEIEFTITVKKP